CLRSFLRGGARWLLWALARRSSSCYRPDCRIDNAIIYLPSSNRASAHTLPTNLWQPGESGNPAGRLRGSRNRLSEAVISALLRDFSKHGEKAIAKVRRTQPAAYLKVPRSAGAPRTQGRAQQSPQGDER